MAIEFIKFDGIWRVVLYLCRKPKKNILFVSPKYKPLRVK